MSSESPLARLLPLTGRWRGLSRVWFEPGVLADESPVELEVVPRLGDRLLQFGYRTSLQGKPVEGQLIVGHYPGRKRWEAHLIDSFHMGRGQLFCTGDATASGFSVLGHYPDGQDGPDWGWRIELTLGGPGDFTLCAFNVMPSGEEAKATEMALERQP